ncbi:MAG: DUF1015 family protein [Lachnospiraceae bacterium]|nr:DUF1015 family protein [Lachnospiraceae bacterium]
MAIFRPFAAVRPTAALAEKVAALPYDVMNSEEARQMVVGNPYSFLHVDKAEIDLDPDVDIYDEQVYEKAADNLQKMSAEGTYIKEEKPCFYIYQQVMNGRKQAGIVGCASIDDYMNQVIKKHELTRADKEADRIHHVDSCNANTGPIFLTYRSQGKMGQIMHEWMESHAPLYDFTAEDGIGHTVWIMDDERVIRACELYFQNVPAFYIADGHHRAASAVKVGQKRRKDHPDYTGLEEFNFFLAVLFPGDELAIMDYNRVVHDLNGLSKDEFLDKIGEQFTVSVYGDGRCKPDQNHTMGMYLDHQWYELTVKSGTFDETDPVEKLDVSILQKNLLTPVLGIGDPRTDKRIDFIGGIRGLEELERLVDGGMAVAFAMYPTTIDELMDIADADQLMPPKSTWFEPKLRSGIFVHELD